MADRVVAAIRQLRKGETIGRRGTPAISFWPMRPKWEKYGNSPWAVLGTDGDSEIKDGQQIIPAVLQLVYFRCADGRVCQLAYVLEPEYCGPMGTQEANEAAQKYLHARDRFMPEVLTA